MNRKDAKFLYSLDFSTLADIATKELNNANKLNIYYDLISKEAIVYPEDDKPNIPLRPLRTRLLKDGHRMGKDISSLIADSIMVAMKDNGEEKN